MKIKKKTFSTLVLELFFPSIANYMKLKIQKNPKIDFPYCAQYVDPIRQNTYYITTQQTTISLSTNNLS
jgi:hypothetical protein